MPIDPHIDQDILVQQIEAKLRWCSHGHGGQLAPDLNALEFGDGGGSYPQNGVRGEFLWFSLKNRVCKIDGGRGDERHEYVKLTRAQTIALVLEHREQHPEAAYERDLAAAREEMRSAAWYVAHHGGKIVSGKLKWSLSKGRIHWFKGCTYEDEMQHLRHHQARGDRAQAALDGLLSAGPVQVPQLSLF